MLIFSQLRQYDHVRICPPNLSVGFIALSRFTFWFSLKLKSVVLSSVSRTACTLKFSFSISVTERQTPSTEMLSPSLLSLHILGALIVNVQDITALFYFRYSSYFFNYTGKHFYLVYSLWLMVYLSTIYYRLSTVFNISFHHYIFPNFSRREIANRIASAISFYSLTFHRRNCVFAADYYGRYECYQFICQSIF